jgi:leader peptidase (prepilin peptidase)/N-methyltransferase
VSFLLLGARCRSCREPISWRYPVVEALSIGVGGVILWRFGPTWPGLRMFLLGLGLVAVTFIDLEHLLIPDRITLPGIAVGLLTALYPAPGQIVDALGGCLLAGGLFYLVALASRGGMGGGDVKLAAMIGAFLGWQLALVAVFVGVLAGGLVGIGLLLGGLKGRKDPVPFGPFLALGGFVAAVWGAPLIRWYLR